MKKIISVSIDEEILKDIVSNHQRESKKNKQKGCRNGS